MFEQVAKRIGDYIASEKLPVGSKIPTERELSSMLEVSRSSIREGLRVLELLRFLESKQGEGTFVSSPPSFLIPSHELGSSLEFETLNQYFEIFIHCSEKIVIKHINNEPDTYKNRNAQLEDEEDFWNGFCFQIEVLGKKMNNPALLSLWQNTKNLLLKYGYFSKLHVDIQLDLFISLLYKKDITNLNIFFSKLSAPTGTKDDLTHEYET